MRTPILVHVSDSTTLYSVSSSFNLLFCLLILGQNKKISETSFRDLGHGDSLGHLLGRFFLYDKYKANRANDGSKQDPIDHIR